jgi:hypothetical protein
VRSDMNEKNHTVFLPFRANHVGGDRAKNGEKELDKQLMQRLKHEAHETF